MHVPGHKSLQTTLAIWHNRQMHPVTKLKHRVQKSVGQQKETNTHFHSGRGSVSSLINKWTKQMNQGMKTTQHTG